MSIVKREGLGRPMTWGELDGNFDAVESLRTEAAQSVAQSQANANAAAASSAASEQARDDAQAAAEQVEADLERVIKAPTGETINQLPVAASRTDTLMGFDEHGQPKVYPVSRFDEVSVSELWSRSLAEAGYNFLGFYVAGITFTSKLDVIVHDGIAFKLNDSTDVGFVTTGFFTVDVNSFEQVDGLLRQELRESKGTDMIGYPLPDGTDSSLSFFIKSAINELTPEMFRGDLQKTFTAAAESGLHVSLAAKNYEIEESIEINGSVSVSGQGRHLTKIIQQDGGSGFVQKMRTTSDAMCFSGFSLITTRSFDKDNIAISVDSSSLISASDALIGDRTRARGFFRDIAILGNNENRSQNIGWGVGIDLNAVGWYDINDVQIRGCATPDSIQDFQGKGILHRGGGWTVETFISKIRMYFLDYGFHYPDYTEGAFISDVNLVFVRNGMVAGVTDPYWSADPAGKLGAYNFTLDNIHVNASDVGVLLSDVKNTTISDLFMILDDRGVATETMGCHLRNGSSNTLRNINTTHYSTQSGLTRQSVLLNNITDSTAIDIKSLTYNSNFERHSSTVRIVNASSRNKVDCIHSTRADSVVINEIGCGNNTVHNYRYDDVTNPIVDNTGDLIRGNAEGRLITFTPTGGNEFVVTVTPRQQFSRAPRGVTATIVSPTTLPMDVFYDVSSSTATAIVLRIKPSNAGSSLPTTLCQLSLTIHD